MNVVSRDRLLATFFGNLRMLLGSGITLADALGELVTVQSRSDFKSVLADVEARVLNGERLSDALGQHGNYFDAYVVGSVSGAEENGTLAECFNDLAKQLREQSELIAEVRSALVYPVFLIFTSLVSLFFIFVLVIPQLLPLLESVQRDGSLSYSARVLITLAELSSAWGKPLFALLLLGVCIAYLLRAKIDWHRYFVTLASCLPASRRLLNGLELARFFKSMGSLLNAGVPQTQAIQTSLSMLLSPKLKAVGVQLLHRVNEGHRFAENLANLERREFGLSRESNRTLLFKTIKYAERAGQLPQGLLYASNELLNEFRIEITKATKLIEPSLILMLGLIVGGVVYVIFAALQSVNTVFL